MGAVHLSVSDLGRSIAYYESVIGLLVHAPVVTRHAACGTFAIASWKIAICCATP